MPKDENIITRESQAGTLFPGNLRDWFAGMALLVARGNQQRTPEDIAKRAYVIADAMLFERT